MGITKQETIEKLLLEVESRYAIQPTQSLLTKIKTVFERLPDEALYEWFNSIKPLGSDHPEWQSFVEGLTVHETYFCRDNDLLLGIRDFILPYLLAQKTDKKLRIWSAACSTGEEAYNLCFLIMEALYTFKTGKTAPVPEIFFTTHGWNIEIFATDLSKQVLRIAEAATYNDSVMGSFRTDYKGILPYFDLEKTEQGAAGKAINHYRVKKSLKNFVKFSLFNLSNENPPFQNLDLIICRNVLIYFNQENKKKIQQMLDKSLVPSGILITGAVDPFFLDNYQRYLKNGCLWYKKNSTNPGF